MNNNNLKKENSPVPQTNRPSYLSASIDKGKEGLRKGAEIPASLFSKENKEKLKSRSKDFFDKSIVWCDRASNFMLNKNYKTGNDPIDSARGPIVVGVWAMIILFGVFGIWSVTAPISSAVVARGQIVVFSNKKTIQHLEGGIISEILVKEGDLVTEGQPLLKLNDTSAKARSEMVLSQLRVAKASELRLLAERDDLPEVKFNDPRLQDIKNPEIVKIIQGQAQLFQSKRNALIGQVNVYKQKIDQLSNEINGLTSQEKSSESQLQLINEEIRTVQQLVDKGQGLKPRLLALKRNAAELEGDRGRFSSLIAKARQTITETELELINIKNEYLGKVVAELKDIQAQVADLEERLRAADDILQRTVIISPQTGRVNGLKYHTIGGVIPPGGVILDIVPQDDRMVLDAQVMVHDIDQVMPGLPAKVRVSSANAMAMPMIDGKVVRVSADRFVDEVSRMPYYTARIELDEEMAKKFSKHVELYPGMQADVLIVTGGRTFMSYFLQPLHNSMIRAFREE